MLKCMDCGAEGVSGIHGCNWTGKDSPVTRVEFDALTQRLNTDERRAWDANARINDAVFDLTQRVAALEAAQAARDHDGHDAACARGIEMAAEALARVAALEGQPAVSEKNRVSDPPTEPSLLPCPFCGSACALSSSRGEVVCGTCNIGVVVEVWNRRPPADARLRALALEVADSATPGNIADLRAYLRETAR